MLQRSLRDPVAKLIAPLVKILIKLRISANLISTIGGLGSAASALYFFPKGEFTIGVLWVAGFVIFDLFDGAVARASHKGVSKWGAVLDSTLDRLSDAAIFIGALLFFIENDDPLVPLIIIAAVAAHPSYQTPRSVFRRIPIVLLVVQMAPAVWRAMATMP